MTGFNATITDASRELTAREKIKKAAKKNAVNAKAIAFPRRSRLVIFFRLSLNLQKQNRSF